MRIEKILILEDNDVLRKEVASYLRELDYEVIATSTIKEAREAMARDNFDLFLSDMRLPDGESIQLLRELQSRARQTAGYRDDGIRLHRLGS